MVRVNETPMHIPKWLIATAGLSFVVLIAAVAFFIGRDASRPPAAPTAAAVESASPVPQELSAVRDPAPPEGAPQPPLAETSGAITPIIAPPVSGTAPTNATTPGASAPDPTPDNSQATDARARVAAYFKQMEAIRSGGTIGDPQEFATTLVNAAANGDVSGIDDLVRAATDAERRAAALQPPGECAEYHRLATTLLQESRTMITALRDGLKRNDTEALTSMATSAQNMKSRADRLAEAEKSLRARFGL
jgi:hypothetical protein